MSAPVPWFFVTGCDSGFGRIVADKLSKEHGHKVFAGIFNSTSASLYESNPNVVSFVVDVTSDGSVADAFALMTTHLQQSNGELRGVVNNAGVMLDYAPSEMMPLDALRTLLAVNVEGTVRVSRAALPLLRKATQPRIVNVASMVASAALPGVAYYSASKAAVHSFSEALYREVAQFGINVSIINPGVFPSTGLFETYMTGLDRLWKQAPESLRVVYGDEWKKQTEQRMQLALDKMGNTHPERVPEAMVHALLSPKPQQFYYIGKDSVMVQLLPYRLLDKRFRSMPRAAAAKPEDATFTSRLPYALVAVGSALALAKL